MKKLLTLVLFVFSYSVMASGTGSEAAAPVKIIVDGDNGFMVFGRFGNPAECSVANVPNQDRYHQPPQPAMNRFIVRKTHPQYAKIYSTVLTAYAGRYKIKAYVTGCEALWPNNLNIEDTGTGPFNVVGNTDGVEIFK